ncbi:Thioredoxin-like fold,Ribosomal protein/NADH dehydrogenase domain [Cinara cedri]|uniref:Small ribosomal subunit protein mS25 n=1 Tax=Cinara cedri TaxID=506608 RepID=A0A5E4MEL4_9HEMI|nr:Thioredoxin-like fold,Ribosomal protein/NADH dehydrogenase domain [Cinara cedri]
MPFMKGAAPIRRTMQYLDAGKIVFKDRIKIFSVHYNTLGENHHGTREFVFWHLPQIQFKNPDVQVLTLKNMTPTPFIRCYMNDGKDMLIDVDNRDKDRIHDHILEVLGKPKETLEMEAMAREKKDNPANFGYMCEKHCMCEILGQVPCPSVVPLPKSWRGKFKNEEL